MVMSFFRNHSGQALVEYLLLVVFMLLLTVKLVGSFSTFMRDSMGNLGHVLTMNLTTGVCAEECFFSSYRNGYTQ